MEIHVYRLQDGNIHFPPRLIRGREDIGRCVSLLYSGETDNRHYDALLPKGVGVVQIATNQKRKETEQAIDERLVRKRKQNAQKRLKETAEEKEERWKKGRELAKQKRLNKTENEMRLAWKRELAKQNRQKETAEEREKRLAMNLYT